MFYGRFGIFHGIWKLPPIHPLFLGKTVTTSYGTLFRNTDVDTRALLTREWNLCHWSFMLLNSLSMRQRIYLFILSHLMA